MGPLLFIIYINDFSRASDLLFSIVFADDTSVFIEGTNYNKVIDISNQELKRVDFWLKANKLTINTKKTHYMMFHRTRIKLSPLFKRLNILNFRKLVIQRIALLMFKYDKGVLPQPINNIFSVNNERHNYNSKHNHDLQINTGNGEIV